MADEFDFTEHIEDGDVLEFIEKKGFKSVSDPITAYRELEKKQGSMVTVPGEDASVDDINSYLSRIAPKGDYESDKISDLVSDMPEGAYDEDIDKTIIDFAKASKLPKHIESAMRKAFFVKQSEIVKDLDSKAENIKKEDEKARREIWKGDYDKNMVLSSKAMEKTKCADLLKKFGLDGHPNIRGAFLMLSKQLEETKTETGGSDTSEKGESWFTDYSETKQE
jgi:hypothetical protein